MIEFSRQIFQQESIVSHSIIIRSRSNYDTIVSELKKQIQQQSPGTNLIEYVSEEDLLSINDVRELRSITNLKQNSARVIVVKAIKFPVITQNSLLKLLEDGASQTTLIFVTTSSVVLLPTVLSRVLLIDELASKDNDAFAADFFAKSQADRLSIWEEVNSAESLSMLANYSLYLVGSSPTMDSDLRSQIVQAHSFWQSGQLAPKYFFEFISLSIPINK